MSSMFWPFMLVYIGSMAGAFGMGVIHANCKHMLASLDRMIKNLDEIKKLSLQKSYEPEYYI